MRSPVNHLLRQIGFMVIVAEGSLYDLPSSLRLLPAVVIDARKARVVGSDHEHLDG